MTLPVKYYANTMQGAPQLTNDWGCMTALLDAVLVTGFNLKTIETLTSDAGVATANIPAGHLYWVGQVLTISGADQNEYNGEVRVIAVTTSTFTYAITGTSVSPATGASITSKVAPLGWEIAFTATNKRAYRSKNVLSNRPYLRVDDSCDPAYTTTYAKKAKVTMAQGMSDIDTFVGARAPFDSAYPTRNEVATGSGAGVYDGWYKWYYARSDGNAYDHYGASVFNRPWTLVGDDRGFYIFNDTWSSGGLGGKCFTDFESYRSADGFNTLLCAQEAYNYASIPSSSYDSEGYQSSDWRSRFPRTLDGVGKILMRSYLQIGNNVNPSFTSLNTNNGQTTSGYSTGISWPNGPDYSMILHPTLLRESSHLRGRMPGMFWVHNDSPSFNHLDTISGVAGYPGRTFLLLKVAHGVSSGNYTATLAFDITGPWW
jgi:hypothetical protein